MTRFPHLATRLFNVPVAIHPQKAEIVMAALAERLGVARLFRDGEAVALRPGALALAEEARARGRNAVSPEERSYDVVAGVAVIPIRGTLVHKLGSLRPYSGMTGYDGIRLNLLQALDDPDVRAIVLDVDSPGGEVAGCFDLVDLIHEARGAKPIHAILDEAAYSAAYAIASAADRVTVPRTGGTGSIGVILLHADLSKALTAAGVNVTLIRHGQRKYEGNEYEPLSKDALARLQADTDEMGELFVATVARNRGLKASAVRAMEAGTYLGAAGVTAGLADAVRAPDDAFGELLASL